MSLWDPEAAGNAAVFLRLDDMKMLEIRNAPFEGAKAVWVPNSETGYIKAEVVGKGDKPNTTKVSVLKFPLTVALAFWTILDNLPFRSFAPMVKKRPILMTRLKSRILQSTNCLRIWPT